jgi:hypothetical protein
MTPEQFTYWLQGFAELTVEPPTREQWQLIKEHLQTVFYKVTPALQPPIFPTMYSEPAPPFEITCDVSDGVGESSIKTCHRLMDPFSSDVQVKLCGVDDPTPTATALGKIDTSALVIPMTEGEKAEFKRDLEEKQKRFADVKRRDSFRGDRRIC